MVISLTADQKILPEREGDVRTVLTNRIKSWNCREALHNSKDCRLFANDTHTKSICNDSKISSQFSAFSSDTAIIISMLTSSVPTSN